MSSPPDDLVTLDDRTPVWQRVFTVAPLVLVGTVEPDGELDLAPKHMVTPLGQSGFFGFVCTPAHATYRNIRSRGEFTVSYPRASEVVYTALAASPRDEEGRKPAIQRYPVFPAKVVEGSFFADSYLFLECELHDIFDGFGDESLIAGRIVAAHARSGALRGAESDEREVVGEMPLLAYLSPSRFAEIAESRSFPFPADFQH